MQIFGLCSEKSIKFLDYIPKNHLKFWIIFRKINRIFGLCSQKSFKFLD